MIPERKDNAEPAQPDPQPEVEYVGAPTEYAERDEVPEAISFLAQAFAGIGLAWGIAAAVLSLAVFGCLCWLCTSSAFVAALFGG